MYTMYFEIYFNEIPLLFQSNLRESPVSYTLKTKLTFNVILAKRKRFEYVFFIAKSSNTKEIRV